MRLAALVLVVLIAGCDSADPLAAVDAEASVAVTTDVQLADAQAAWEASGIDDYTFEYRLECFCENGDRVTVRDGRVVQTTRRDPAEALTIDDLFARARDDRQHALASESAYAVARISTGTPVIPVLVQAGTTDPRVADGFVRLVVTGFEAL